MFLNYLFHDAPGTPSHPYSKRKTPRSLTEQQQQTAIKKYRKMYKRWIAKERPEQNEKMQKRIGQVRTIQRLLGKRRIETIG